MSLHKTIRFVFRGFAPRGIKGILGLVVVAVLAFALGGVFFGNGHELSSTGTAVHDHEADLSKEPTSWTCSMHPQIKLSKPGKCPICFMDLIPLESDSGDQLGPRQLRLTDAAIQLAQIQTTPVVQAFAEADIRMVGKITYNESKVSYITAWVPGRLDRLYADFTGVTVKKGDRLVSIYSPELLAAQEELLQARAAVKSLDGSASGILRSTAQATVDAVREKLRLFGLTHEQIQNIETSGRGSDHSTIYSPIGGVVVHKDAKEGMYVSTGKRIYTIADLSSLWVTFDAYESDLPWLRYGQRAEFTVPSIPGERFDAVVGFIDPFVDSKTRTVKVRAVVDNKDGRLKPDMFVKGIIRSRINSEGDIIDEYLADKWIAPMHPEIIKSGPGTCDVCGRALVPAASLGYTGEALEEENASLLIPASAPLITGKRAVVYVKIKGDGEAVFEGREIELGPRAGDYYIVKSGVEVGEAVVSNGAFKIDSELQIQAKPSMMLPVGGGSVIGHQHGRTTPDSDTHTENEAAATKEVKEGNAALQALTPVYNSYFDVQMALAKDDFKKAKEAGKKLTATIKNVDKAVFSRKGHSRWMELSKRLSKQAEKLASTEDIKAAREVFIHLSEAAIELHETFGHAAEQNYYLTFCPMARDGKGTHWLQMEDIVWNSIYGKLMLRCGSIQDTLAPVPSGKK